MNSLSALNPALWKPIVQDFLNNMLISMAICNTKCEELLQDGSSVNFPYVSDVRIQDYSQGTDLDIDPITATQSTLTVNQSKAATFPLDPVQEKQARADYGMELAYQSAFQLKNNIDQNVINAGINAANNTIAGGSLTTSTIAAIFNSAYAQLSRNNAVNGEMFAVIDPERQSLLTQTFIANGFVEADEMLRNQFVGRAFKFNVYVSNNLPSTQLLTIEVNPTAGDTLFIFGQTWTFVANGTAAAAGDISLGTGGGALATTQANVRAAINGTGTPGASTYIEISSDNRTAYENQQVAASAFSSDDSTITAFGKIGATASDFTSASNFAGVETSYLLFGRKGAISLAIQMYPELYINQEPKQLTRNYITHTLFGTAVFFRDKKRLVRVSYNV